MSDLAIMLRIKADGSGAKAVFNGVETDLNRVGAAARKAGGDARQGGAGIAEAGQKAERAGQQARSASTGWSSFGNVIGSLAIGATVAALARMADLTTLLDARLRIVSNSAEEYANANGLVFDIAQRTRSELAATANLYSRLSQSLKETGASQAEVARLTETINKAFQVSGATTTEAAAATTQLAQGLAAGALRGDEFNSVAEQAPAIMDALAKSLGVTRGELRAMAEDGKITAEAVRTALGEAADDIDAKFAKIPPTIGGALTQLTNALQVTVGWFNQAGGASNVVVRGINFITEAVQKLPGMLFVVIGSAREFWVTLRTGFETVGVQIKMALGAALDGIRIAIAQQIASIALSLKNIPVAGVQQLADGLAKTALGLKNSATSAAGYRKELLGVLSAGAQQIEAIRAQTAANVLAFEAEKTATASTREGAVATRASAEEDKKGAAEKRALAKAVAELELALRKAFIDGLRPAKQEMQEFSATTGRLVRSLVQDIPQVVNFGQAARESLERLSETSTEEAQFFADNWAGAVGTAQDAFADFVAGNIKSFEDFGDALESIARQFLANLVRQFLSTNLNIGGTNLGSLFGGGGAGGAPGGFNFGGPGAGLGTRFGLGVAGVGIAYQGYQQGNPLMGAAGGALTGFQIAGPIGAIIGAALGGLAAALNDTTRRITIIGSELVGTAGFRNLAPDAIRQSALGGFAFASIDNVGREERDQLAQAIQQFDASIAQLLDEEQLQRVKDAVAQVNTQATEGAITADTFIRQRFDAVLSTMSDAVRAFVAEGETFEDQVQRLGQVLQFPREIQAVIDGLAREDLLASMTELERRTFEVNERFDAAIEFLRERSATEEQLAQVEAFRARALAALTEATEGSVGGLVRDAARIGAMLDQLRFDESLIGLSDLERALAQLAREAANAAREAAELGATEAELAEIREIYAARAARIEAEAAARAAQEAAAYWQQVQEENARAAQQAADAIRAAFGGLADWLRGEMFGETSTLTPAEQFAAAQEQFQDTLRRAAAGDQNAAQGIQGAAQRLLEQALSFLGGGDAYRQLREAVLGSLGPLAALGQSGTTDGGALQGGPAAALRRFLELMRGFGIDPTAIGTGGLGFGEAANGRLNVPGQVVPIFGDGRGAGASSALAEPGAGDPNAEKLARIEDELKGLREDVRVATGSIATSIDYAARQGKSRFG